MDIIIECAACFLATISFGILIQQPKNTLFISALIALNGYIIFILSGKQLKAFFLSGLCVGLLSEAAARLLKMTTTIFLISSIIPLVPGYGLYRSVMLLAEQNYFAAMVSAAETIGGLCVIALSLTVATMLFSNIPLYKIKGVKNAHTDHK